MFFQSTTRVKPFICTMPMRLDEGWNQIQFNLSDFTRRAYGESRTHCTADISRLFPLSRWSLLFCWPQERCFEKKTPSPTNNGVTKLINTRIFYVVQALTTLKRCACKYMRTAASGASTSLIACIRRKSFPQNSNFSFPFRCVDANLCLFSSFFSTRLFPRVLQKT